jgi:uncharacterized membrane protein YphA (DoxX/SURF4 family)
MLNLVPIQFLAPLAYLTLRLFIGIIWLLLAKRHFLWRKEIKASLAKYWFPSQLAIALIILTELAAGILFLAGFLTQIAAILSIIWCLKLIILRPVFSHPSFGDQITVYLLLGISISLFITGAGSLAFDLPI